ncbi:DUF721 domain-containing protein [Streptomyces reticuli]|uniref:DUF721 domain-containing protein n=1 Tax=Streptomyces reticuli TaxID=1926 RepID=UPI000743E26D
MVAPAADGSVLAQFNNILAAAAPELAGHVRAVQFDADIGRLDVTPDAPAYGTQLRWRAPELIEAANERVQGANVRAVHIQRPGPPRRPPTQPSGDARPPGGSAGRCPRDTAGRSRHTGRPPGHPGWLQLSRRRWSGRPPRCGSCRRAFPEPDIVPDDAAAPIEHARAQRRRQAAAGTTSGALLGRPVGRGTRNWATVSGNAGASHVWPG